ncbi:MAG: hypothetical protein JXA30_04000 [Deltaproteobacteria bacterium]|nr:hypothetical protein [Deltaproteobacteria bacterium]
MEAHDYNEPIPSPVCDLVAVFEKQLSGVQFPGVDHQTLASLIERVRGSAEELASVKAQVAAAETALENARTELLDKAKQALAYAKIYAAVDPELLERLNGIELGKRQKKQLKAKAKVENGVEAPRKRGRKAARNAETSVSDLNEITDTTESPTN